MDRDHALCRRCKHVIRLDWHECAHCGVRSPAPRTLVGTITAVVPWLVLLAAAGMWWAFNNADVVGRVADVARHVVQVERGAGEALRPAPSTSPGGAGTAPGSGAAWGAAPLGRSGSLGVYGAHTSAGVESASRDEPPATSVRASPAALRRAARSQPVADSGLPRAAERAVPNCPTAECVVVAAPDTVRVKAARVPTP